MIFDKDGRKLGHRFFRALMRSAASLTYEQAQAAIDGRLDEVTGPLLETVLRPLWGAYASLVLARTERGPLDLDLPERKILLDEQGRVRGVASPPRLDAHRLIEEFMIAANVAAAETLEAKRSPLIYRVHDSPVEGEARLARRVPEHDRDQAAEIGHAQARPVQPHPRRDPRHARPPSSWAR